MNFYGFIALLISLAIWGFIFFSVGLVVWEDYQESKKKTKKSKKIS